MTSSADQRLAALRAWCARAEQDPAGARTTLDASFTLAGELFDEGHLDGAQYAALYALAAALRRHEDAEARRCAAACVV